MYKVNDFIMYGKNGICKIVDITTPAEISTEKGQLYYVLQPVNDKCVIYTPIDANVFMRDVISAEEAERLIDTIPTIQAEAYYNDRTQELRHHYEDLMKTYDCGNLISLTMSIYEKKKQVELQNRKLGQIDDRFMKQAEDLIFSEFSIALDMPKENVQAYIASRVEGRH